MSSPPTAVVTVRELDRKFLCSLPIHETLCSLCVDSSTEDEYVYQKLLAWAIKNNLPAPGSVPRLDGADDQPS